jgi:hypothetical protein
MGVVMSISISVAYVAEIERLRHDIERHIAIASELATENERLREYAGHRLGCASRRFILTGRMEPAQWCKCDCGYYELIKEIGNDA